MSDKKDDSPDAHGWIEYRRLILNELEQLNAMTAGQSVVLREIDRTLIRQSDQLAEHMRRTEAAEKSIEALAIDVAPLKRKAWLVDIIFKCVLGAVGAVAGAIELIKFLNKS